MARSVEELFHAARERSDPEERRRFLDEACAGQAELRVKVEELLSAHEGLGSRFLATPLAAAPIGERAGDTIGRYRLLQEIGQGGMGTVWMAEQREPVVRKVALKIIKLGLDTREVVVRFEAERQALALMDHPHIAKVLDGGATASGRPYFVMELVKGVPITEYCDNAKLGLRERLELFTKVCEAIQHAHHKGVIHRDIKPSNVLVTLHDGLPVPKVIDFGIAKATSAELTKKTLFTQYAQILGTPEYMAPEQAEMSGLDIDTRADVYSLGVLLYELLTGSKPFDLHTAMQAGFQELLRTIREDEPVKPSTRVSTAGRGASPVGLRRELNVEAWSARLRGDLDWIVMRALEKDRSRRYDTPNGFAEDIARYLRDEPVLAAPPSAAYRFTKFVRRRRKTVIAASVVVALLVFGIAGTSWGLVRALAERERADLAADAAREARNESERRRELAETHLEWARSANATLGEVFAGLDPAQSYGTVAELRTAIGAALSKAATAIDENATGEPLEVARLQQTLGQSLVRLGQPKLAIDVLESALERFREQEGADSTSAMACANVLVSAHVDAGDAKRAVELGLALHERAEELLPIESGQRETIAGNVAVALRAAGQPERGVKLLEGLWAARRAALGPDGAATVVTINSLAMAYQAAGDNVRALELLEDNRARLEARLGPDHPSMIECLNNICTARSKLGRPDVELLELTRERAERVFGPEHPNSLVISNNLAALYSSLKRDAEATALLEITLPRMQRVLGPSHENTLNCQNNLALRRSEAGRNAEAIEQLEEVLALRRVTKGADHPVTLNTMGSLASCYRNSGQAERALPLFEEGTRRLEARFGPQHRDTMLAFNNLAGCCLELGQVERAVELYAKAFAALEALGFRSEFAARISANAANTTETAGKFEAAAAIRRKWLAELEKREGVPPVDVALECILLGSNLLRQKNWSEAETFFRRGLALRREHQPDRWNTFLTQSYLGESLLGQGRLAEAEVELLEGVRGLEARLAQLPEGAQTRVDEARERLVRLYTALGRPADAERWKPTPGK